MEIGLIGAGNMASALARGIGEPALVADVDAAKAAALAAAIVSILAATDTARLEAAYPDVPVYRFIPNIPAEVRQGVLCYVPGRLAADGPEQEILALFGRAGAVIPLESEPLIEPA